ncbi:dual specificity protein kinase splA [Folsomia candida]|uniref:dual specificity protein kinase splA n=1 Tax=Folsomia candida TaxID=158441 RepID=UPI0016054670|nr:dual specificity protein kinase splA [Folsomia candida]
MYPPLGKGHQVFGKDFCSGFVDKDGNWNNGFYCPPISPDTSTAIFCCGDAVFKYCCTQGGSLLSPANGGPNLTSHHTPDGDMEVDFSKDYDLSTHLAPATTMTTTTTITTPAAGEASGDRGGGGTILNIKVDIARNSTVAAVICGLVAVTVLMIIVTCFYCKCCLLYKKRRSQLQLPGGLYRIPASSTSCGLMNSSNSTTTPTSNFNHSHNSAFVAAIPIPVLDPWSGTAASQNAMPPIPPAQQQPLLFPSGQGRHHPQQPTLLRNNVANHNNQAQILNGGRMSRPTNLSFPARNSPDNSSNSSISTISSFTPTSRPQHQPQQQQQSSNSISISRTNSIPSQNTAAIALRLQRQLLQTHYQNQQQQQNPNNLSLRNTNSNHQQQQGYNNYSRNGNIARAATMTLGSNQAHIPTIYTVGGGGGRSSYPSASTMSSLLNSVSFSPTSNSSSNHNSLPPPYFLEQYRIRNRVRVPRNPPLVPPPSSNNNLLPSYNEIQQQLLRETICHTLPSEGNNNNGTRCRPRNDTTHFSTSQQIRRQPNNNHSRRPNHHHHDLPANIPSPVSSPVTQASPLNDLSAAPSSTRRGSDRSCKGAQGTRENNNSNAGSCSSPSSGITISRQITEENNVPAEFHSSGKILNTTPILQNSPLRSSSEVIKSSPSLLPERRRTGGGESICKRSQSLENVNVTSAKDDMVEKTECGGDINSIRTGGADM